jgi:hypothetical protein
MGTRLSEGVWRTKAGKLVKSATDPDAIKKPGKDKTKAPAAASSALSESLQGLAATGVTPQPWQVTPGNFADQREKFRNEAYTNMTSDYAKRQGAQQQQLEQDLYNRGYRPDQTTTEGPGGWKSMTGELTDRWNDAYANAAFQASQLAGQEFDRVHNAENDIISQQTNRELGLGGIASNTLGIKSNEKIAKKQLAQQAAIARMNAARRYSGAPAAASNDPGFDVLGGTI